MAKTLISRLDAENIVRAAVDPDTHEATGDVYDSVNDVSYPFGGGGLSFPYLTVELTNTSAEYYLENYGSSMSTQLFVEDDGKLTLQPVPAIEASGTEILKFLYFTADGDFFVNLTDDSTLIVASSDAVNCVLSDGSIAITDPTIPASIKISMEGGR